MCVADSLDSDNYQQKLLMVSVSSVLTSAARSVQAMHEQSPHSDHHHIVPQDESMEGLAKGKKSRDRVHVIIQKVGLCLWVERDGVLAFVAQSSNRSAMPSRTYSLIIRGVPAKRRCSCGPTRSVRACRGVRGCKDGWIMRKIDR